MEDGGEEERKLHEIGAFLKEHEEILKFLAEKPRCFLSHSTWEAFPWQSDVDQYSLQDIAQLKWLDEGHEGEGNSLAAIGRIVRSLALCKAQFHKGEEPPALTAAQCVGMTPKKRHEVAHMARLVNGVCDEKELVVDVGAGLGYLTCTLSQTYGRTVLGIEGCESGKLAAEDLAKRKKLLEHCKEGTAKFEHFLVSRETTVEAFRKFVGRECNTLVALVGLHCCGELSNHVIRLFLEDECVRKLVLCGCCYGRLGLGEVMTFPVSQLAKDQKFPFFDAYVMRVACDSATLWKKRTFEDFKDMIREMFCRAVTEKILDSRLGEGAYKCGRIPRRLLKDFPAYFAHAVKTAKIDKPGDFFGDLDKEKLEVEFNKWFTEDNEKKIALLLAARTSLSSLIESCILYDRIAWIRETLRGKVRVRAEACFEPSISPTNIVICAEKI